MATNNTISLIDTFRFITRQEDIDSTKSTTTTTTNNKRNKLICLDLRPKLETFKHDNPWHKLEQLLFERLMIEDYSSFEQVELDIEVPSENFEFSPDDSNILRYLYGCYCRLKQSNLVQDHDNVEQLILNQVVLYLTEPELFPDRDRRSKNNQATPVLLNLVHHYYSDDIAHQEAIQNFVNLTAAKLDDAGLEALVAPTYTRMLQKFALMTIDDPTLQTWLNVAQIFLQNPQLAKKMLEKNILKLGNSLAYQSTLIGFMLCISSLPRTNLNEMTFFKNPIRFGESDHKFTESQLAIKMQLLAKELHKLFHNLLKLPQTRSIFLTWIGRCLHTFKDRKKMWNNQVLMGTTIISVNDGFLMNFFSVMLHLSEPFAGPYNVDLISTSQAFSLNKRMLKIDPRYCSWSKPTHEDCLVNFLGLAEETFLINSRVDTEQQTPIESTNLKEPNFITECFFGTHQTFSIGFRSVSERFYKLARDINELQQAYQNIMAQPLPSIPGHDPREMIRDRMDEAMSQFLNLKAVLMVPSRITMQLHFSVATAAYLNHLVACQNFEEVINATEFKTVSLEMLRENKVSRACLQFIPEMLLENIIEFFIFLKQFNEEALSRAKGMMEPIMTLIITFMGNSSLMQNPHLRARFAEILECFMPNHNNHHHGRISSFNGCENLFTQHPLSDELMTSMVSVFVSIEMLGENTLFEQKFTYRRPMYSVLEYLWNMQRQKQKLIELAEEAEININSARQPLFLRFANLLMNDAIFLLDEALNGMNKLREHELRTKTEEWRTLSAQQRAQAERMNSDIGRMARFHNVLGLSTIGTLAWMTDEIKTIFSHPTLVDRIANMLNYFLEHLVGPKKGKFNVNDKNDYEFKPLELLEKICRIYINLGLKDSNSKYKEFCSAVSSDGRSYSKNLLPQATEILFRTGLSAFGAEFQILSQQVCEIAIRNQMDEIDDIPDVFLDPIMSTLMVDPVLLPSSKIVVDRSTIARHLLSDQTDPFNRSPLSMEDVIPDVDLKTQIDNFLKEKRKG